MAIYFESLQQFKNNGGLKSSTITAKQLLPAVVAHMQRMDRKFTLQVNGRLPKSMDALLEEVFELCHLQQPFYTQHCANRQSRYINTSKNRVKIEFTLKYRMSREEEKWTLNEIERILSIIITKGMTDLQKIMAVHDYIVRAYDYELNTTGSPFTVYTFMHERQGVCMAYALLFEKMMELLHIPCYYVVGKADGEGDAGHAWNMVQLDDEWYHIDATWNDLGKRTNGHEIRYRYFLRSDDFMKRDHWWNLAHYPICHSDRFDKLSNVYDAAYLKDKLYFPHPRTAFLTMFDTETLAFKALISTRVQFCTPFQRYVYMSNVDNHGFLYRYEPVEKSFELVEARQVSRIYVDEQQFVVSFIEGEALVLQQKKSDEQVSQSIVLGELEQPLMSFGDSWFASYEGEEKTLTFKSEDGICATILQPVKQLTLDIQFFKGLDIKMTAHRKNIVLQQPMQLLLPKKIAGTVDEFRHPSGQRMQVVENDDSYVIPIEKSMRISLQ